MRNKGKIEKFHGHNLVEIETVAINRRGITINVRNKEN